MHEPLVIGVFPSVEHLIKLVGRSVLNGEVRLELVDEVSEQEVAEQVAPDIQGQHVIKLPV